MATTTVTYTGNDESITVPANTNRAIVRLWGGGGGSNGNDSGGDRANGGAGGFVKFTIDVTAGETLTAKVAGGGTKGTSGRIPGAGGGFSALLRGSTYLGIAGGGGGAGGYGNDRTDSWGGSGGEIIANNGKTNLYATGGGGGTQIAGGAGGTPGTGEAGSSFQGGAGGGGNTTIAGGWPGGGNASSNSECGGGGGGGYYGGGGGGGSGTWGAGGGGGSSYTNGSAIDVTHIKAAENVTTAPGSAEDGYQSGIGNGGTSSANGGNGLIYIDWFLFTYNCFVSDSSLLGEVNAVTNVTPIASLLEPGPLGVEFVLAQQWAALSSAPSMLGDANSIAWHLFARVDVPTMLGNPNPLAWHLFARADVPSVLGGPTPLGFHDFTGVLGDATTYYVMDLIGPSGTTRVPISSWQATLQTGLSNYVQCVVPAVQAYASAINAATQFVVSRLVSVPGLGDLTYEMARAPVQTATFDQGPSRYTCTLSGYSAGFAPDEDPSTAYNRTLQDIRSISINQGGVRVRCSIDWLLRPSMRVTAGARTFIVAYINYYVGNNDAYMEVGERT